MKQIFLFSIYLHMDDCFSFSFRFIPSPLTSPLLELNLPSIHLTPFFNWLNIYASVRAVEVFTSCYTNHRCHTHMHTKTHTRSITLCFYHPGHSLVSQRCTNHWPGLSHLLSLLLPGNCTDCPSLDLEREKERESMSLYRHRFPVVRL